MKKLNTQILSVLLCLVIIFVGLNINNIFIYNIEAASWNFSYTGSTQIFVAPSTGNYVLEVWGAQGGESTYGGKGGYSKGTIHLTAGTILYINIGQQPTNYIGGWNGGSTAAPANGTYYGGGGATDISLKGINGTTNWNTIDHLYSRIIVAGGGGGGSKYSDWRYGGYGGGTTGGNGSASGSGKDTQYVVTGGTQTSGGGGIHYWGFSDDGSFGYGGAANTGWGSGAGSGWYGGGGGGHTGNLVRSGGGGSGYTYSSEMAQYYPSGCLLNSDYYLTNTSTTANVRSGHGYATITLSHTCSYTSTITQAPSCVITGIKKYTCTCGSTYTETIPLNAHDYSKKIITSDYLKSAATCTTPSIYYYACAVCDAKGIATFENGSPLGHNAGSYTFENDKHYQYCSICDTLLDSGTHNIKSLVKTKSSCDTEGVMLNYCLVCNYSYETTIPKIEHTLATNYTYDDNKHYSKCAICGVQLSANEHIMNYNIIDNATCEQDGLGVYKCNTCDYSYSETIEKTGHILSDYLYNENSHYKTCEICYKIFDEQVHNFDILNLSNSTCTSQGEISYNCSSCSYSYIEHLSLLEHNFVNESDKNNHYLICSNCGLTNNVDEHSFDYSYDEDGHCVYSCSSCNYSYSTEHTIIDETTNNELHTLGYRTTYCSLCGYVIEKTPLQYEYTINYIDENGNTLIDSITLIDNFDKELSILPREIVGYKPEKETYFLKISNENNSITIIYKKNVFTLSFITNNDLSIDDVFVIYEDEYELPIPTLTDYEFLGWYKSSTFDEETKVDNSISLIENTILYAKWKENCYFSVVIPKTLVLDGNTGCGVYYIKASGHIPNSKILTIIPDNLLELNSINKNVIYANINQEYQYFKNNQLDNTYIGYVCATDNGLNDGKNLLSAGSWNGSFNFVIRLIDE